MAAPVSSAFWRYVREIVLTVAAALGVLCVAGSALMLVTDTTPVVFRSGSMAPAMPTGALALAQDRAATTVKVGDVVSTTGGDGIRVTHRVVDTARRGDGLIELTTRGDANDENDPQTRRVRRVDVVVWSAPQWGYAVTALQAPGLVFLAGGVTGAWAAWWLVSRRRPPAHPETTLWRTTLRDETPPRHARAVAPIALLAALGALLSAPGAEPTRASFLDDSSAASARFAVDKINTLVARSRDVTRATDGSLAALLGPGATRWGDFPPPPFQPTMLSAVGDLTVAFDGARFAYQHLGGAWVERALPSDNLTTVVATYNLKFPFVTATDGTSWWYSEYPTTGGNPDPWVAFQPTNGPTSIVDIDNTAHRIASTDGTEISRSETFGNSWTTVGAPGGTVRMLGYSGTTMLTWGSAGWRRSIDNGASWGDDDVLNALVPTPTDITGGTSAIAQGDNRFIIARGAGGMWRYDGRNQVAVPLDPAY